jgi:hypothetical protein
MLTLPQIERKVNMTPKTHSLTRERASELLKYDRKTGLCYYRTGRCAGKIAGTCENKKHVRYRKDGTEFHNPHYRWIIRIDGISHKLHNVIMLIETGEYPPRDWRGDVIDHDDRNGANNAWKNLVRRTRRENALNASEKQSHTKTRPIGGRAETLKMLGIAA